ncbi:ABC transporter permease [Macrococcus equipercicus]|uniref:ABC transporter permease subunit n=1 Tax=Macrococcus equipercicus TaxID=69967 RepID=A0A9Q9BX25_9STAP|nr:ABC transporter permease subunit [Macrococcus equipercicus]UTH14137.1 ABC transporter permease subunit [Macrococcus equipercicus]
MKKHMKLLLSLVFIVIPFAISVIYFDVLNRQVPQTFYLKTAAGDIKAGSPIAPGRDVWFGTDADGYHIFFEALAGLRITLLFVIGIALFCFLLALIAGAWLSFKKGIFDFVTDAVLTSYYFIPQAIIAYILLEPVVVETLDGFVYSRTTRVIYTTVVLALVLLPTTLIVIRDEIRQLLKRDFIDSAFVLGAGKIRLLWHHVLPNIKSRLLIIFTRLVYQSIMVMAHISFLAIFFGGTDVCFGPGCPSPPTKPAVRELSSLLGYHMRELYSSWWTFVVPLCFVVMLLLAFQLLSEALENSEENR